MIDRNLKCIKGQTSKKTQKVNVIVNFWYFDCSYTLESYRSYEVDLKKRYIKYRSFPDFQIHF